VALILHEGVNPESFKTLNLSMVRMNEAAKPRMPAISMVSAEVPFFSSIAQGYNKVHLCDF
jgi:hypothetical protein